MNRKKKINAILKKRMKKANAKLAPKKTSGYISKSERAKLEQEAKNVEAQESESSDGTDSQVSDPS